MPAHVLFGAGAAAWLLFVIWATKGIGRSLTAPDRHDVLPTDDCRPDPRPPRPKPPAPPSQDWLDFIDQHRMIECAFTDAADCPECGWMAMFGIVTDRMMTGRVRWADRPRGGA